jgi:four helix bundle protein
MIKSYKDLEVWKLSFEIAMDIFKLTRRFPQEEVYSLISQVVRYSRSISANITEGWAKRNYDGVFKHHLIHALGSTAETTNWLDFAKECDYINENEYQRIIDKIDIIGKMITKLHQNWITK